MSGEGRGCTCTQAQHLRDGLVARNHLGDSPTRPVAAGGNEVESILRSRVCRSRGLADEVNGEAETDAVHHHDLVPHGGVVGDEDLGLLGGEGVDVRVLGADADAARILDVAGVDELAEGLPPGSGRSRSLKGPDDKPLIAHQAHILDGALEGYIVQAMHSDGVAASLSSGDGGGHAVGPPLRLQSGQHLGITDRHVALEGGVDPHEPLRWLHCRPDLACGQGGGRVGE